MNRDEEDLDELGRYPVERLGAGAIAALREIDIDTALPRRTSDIEVLGDWAEATKGRQEDILNRVAFGYSLVRSSTDQEDARTADTGLFETIESDDELRPSLRDSRSAAHHFVRELAHTPGISAMVGTVRRAGPSEGIELDHVFLVAIYGWLSSSFGTERMERESPIRFLRSLTDDGEKYGATLALMGGKFGRYALGEVLGAIEAFNVDSIVSLLSRGLDAPPSDLEGWGAGFLRSSRGRLVNLGWSELKSRTKS